MVRSGGAAGPGSPRAAPYCPALCLSHAAQAHAPAPAEAAGRIPSSRAGVAHQFLFADLF